MTYSLLAFSIDNSFTKVGAIAAFAGLIAIAILSLLVFSQAREIKRLREWAGRAPERSAEMEQRISAQAAARAAQAVQAGGIRPVPRTTPLNVRAAGVPTASRLAPAATIAAAAGAPPTDVPVPEGDAQTEQPSGAAANTPAADQANNLTEGEASEGTQDGSDTLPPAPPSDDSTPPEAAAQEGSQPTQSEQDGDGEDQEAPSRADESDQAQESANGSQDATPAPLTAAARANLPRAPLPPAPAETQSEPQQSNDSPSVPQAPVPATPRPQASPPRAPSRPAPPMISASRAGGQAPPRRAPASSQARGDSYKFLKEDEGRSAGRMTLMIVGGAIVAILVIVLVLTSLGGSKKGPAASNRTSSSAAKGAHTITQAKKVVNPGAISIAVLNGTETNGLAHRIAASLQTKGYKQAKPLDGHPPGAYPKTVVEYLPDHSADAESIAQTLDISSSEVRPIESSMMELIGGASVVVVAGADQPTPPPVGSASDEAGGESAGAVESSSESAPSATG